MEFEPKIQKFLDLKKPSTKSLYTIGLTAFADFYKSQGSIGDFIDRLEADRDLGWRKTQYVSDQVISDFVAWLQEKKYAAKTVRAYTNAVQQLAKKCKVPFSTRDVKLPASNPKLKKFNWTVETAVKFFDLFDIQMYRSFGVLIFQSFLDCSTALSLTYEDIQREFEAGVIPLCLDVTRVKTSIPFYSFIGAWGVKELSLYLKTVPNIQPQDLLFPVSKQSVADYFRKKGNKLLELLEEKQGDRNKCGTHSLRASGSTLARDNIKGDREHAQAVDRYLDFFMGKTIAEDRRVYMSKSIDSWRQTWADCVEPYVTPEKF